MLQERNQATSKARRTAVNNASIKPCNELADRTQGRCEPVFAKGRCWELRGLSAYSDGVCQPPFGWCSCSVRLVTRYDPQGCPPGRQTFGRPAHRGSSAVKQQTKPLRVFRGQTRKYRSLRVRNSAKVASPCNAAGPHRQARSQNSVRRCCDARTFLMLSSRTLSIAFSCLCSSGVM